MTWGLSGVSESLTLTTLMKNNTTSSTKEVKTKAEVIKLGIDVHIDRTVVVMMVDGGTPKAPRKFSPPSFLKWVVR